MKCFECGAESNRGVNIEYVEGVNVVKKFVCECCEQEMSERLNEAEAEVPQCNYCFVWGHDAEECPERPEEDGLAECSQCAEVRADAIERPNGSVECAACWSASLDHGFHHCPEAFECEVCGERKRSAVADIEDGSVVCAECRPAWEQDAKSKGAK